MPNLADADRLIVESAADFLDRIGGISRVRRLREGLPAFERGVWEQMARLGWLSCATPKRRGGLGLTAREVALLLEQAGMRLTPEPLVLAVGTASLLSGLHSLQASRLLRGLRHGAVVCVPILPAKPAGDERRAAPAGPVEDAASHETPFVFDGHMGDVFLCALPVDGNAGVYAVPRDAEGVQFEFERTVDGGSLGRLRIDAARLRAFELAAPGTAGLEIARARDMMRLGYSAQLVGLMRESLRLTVEYLKERRQFGVPIGSFQAIQHRCASLYVGVAAARALLFEACEAAGSARQALAAAAAKAKAAEVALKLVEECVQFHGATGYSDEHDMGLFFRRAMTLMRAGGDALTCRQFLAGDPAERVR